MFVVMAKSPGGPRRPLGHFRALKEAQKYADDMNRTLPTDDLTIVEQPDGGRKNFVDAPETAPHDGGPTIDYSVPVEAAQGGTKK